MRSGNYPSRSNKGSTTEMCLRLCVPQAGLPWERPCFHLLTANNPATSGQGATAAVCGGKSGLKQGETRITIAKKVSITFKTGKLRQGFRNFTINIFFSRSISPLWQRCVYPTLSFKCWNIATCKVIGIPESFCSRNSESGLRLEYLESSSWNPESKSVLDLHYYMHGVRSIKAKQLVSDFLEPLKF